MRNSRLKTTQITEKSKELLFGGALALVLALRVLCAGATLTLGFAALVSLRCSETKCGWVCKVLSVVVV